MLRFAAKRLIGAIPTLFLIVTFSFFLMRVAPGGPFDKERIVPPEIEARLIHAYHLDEPLPLQYLRYLSGLFQGDFGPSLKYKDFTVTELIAGGFPVSLRLGGIAVLLALVIGVATGTLAALRQNSGTDYAAMGIAMTGIMIPNFVLAPLLTLVFGLWLSWLPVGGWGGVAYMILPVVALSLYQVGFIARLTRGLSLIHI